MYDFYFELATDGAIIRCNSSHMIVAVIYKTEDGYGYYDNFGFNDEGYHSRLKCIHAVLEGLHDGTILPIEHQKQVD